MLTLSEKLFLLATHDEKGTIIFSASSALPYGLVGAMLLELHFLGRISLENKKIIIDNKEPTGNIILDEILELLLSSTKANSVRYWITKIQTKVKNIQKRIAKQLINKGILEMEEKMLLWLIPMKRYPTVNPVPETKVRSEIKDAVFKDDPIGDEMIALISLVNSCELINEVFEKGKRKEARKKIKEITQKEQVGKAVSQIVEEMVVAVTVAVSATTAVAAASN